MNEELESLVSVAKPTVDHEMLNGQIEEPSAFLELEDEVKQRIPQWLAMMLTKYAIGGLIIRFHTKDGQEMAIQFNTFGDISDYWLEVTPGDRMARLGYIAIGDDPTTDGKAYFIHPDHGDNPPVYAIKNIDFETEEDIIRYGAILVAHQLSDVFSRQLL